MKVSIYIPDDLLEAADHAFPEMNRSEMVQHCIRRTIAHDDPSVIRGIIDDAVSKLRDDLRREWSASA